MVSYKRLKLLIITFTTVFLCIIGRLIYFQIIKTDYLSQQAASQHLVEMKLKTVRGNIYDRNMISFTDREDIFYIIVMPNSFENLTEISEQLSTLTEYDSDKIKQMLSLNKPVTFVIEGHLANNIQNISHHYGVKIIRSGKRYGENSIARHIIGYINDIDNTGYYGIEKAFNEYLSIEKQQSISVIGDATKRSIPGLGYRITNSFNDNNTGICLTLDYHIQDIAEKVANEQLQSGAIVLTEIKTGNILALTSRPNYSQDNINKYIAGKGDELINKVFCAYDAGSIFKIITAATALEDKKVSLDSQFNCIGHINVLEKEFLCHKEEGHGEINFLQAFSYSCNTAFIDLGIKVGYNAITNMAKRFGFGQKIDIFEGLEQQSGNIPSKKYFSDREVANISIGQGEILVTPIQAVDMVTTIANNGIRKKLNIVDSIVDDRGKTLKKLSYYEDNKVISSDIAKEIQKAMEEVVISGTGQMVLLEEYGGAAGKTASAETGWIVNEQLKVHAWFVGYFPAKDPKYAMAVFVEDGKQGGRSAAPIFKDIAEKMMQMGY